MKKVLLLSIITIFLSCSKTANFEKLNVGMTSKEVVDLVGEPTEKTDLFGSEIWIYKVGESGHMVTITSDTISGHQSMEKFAESLKDLDKELKNMAEGIENMDKVVE